MSRSGIAVTLAIGLLVTSGVVATAQSPAPEQGDLVTEEVEPGVERIISDGAGHDLDEKHPTYRYDMDEVFITPDGTVWLSTTYSRSDNDANPPGALVWALGQPGTTSLPDGPFCGTRGRGVTCFDPVNQTETTYLAGTPINEIAIAPDGTIWAVGGYGGDNGGLYRIMPE
jgi:hypothetical protein